MSRKIDMVGQRFGRLVVIEEAGKTPQNTVLWKCKCDCGNEVVVRGTCLRNGHTTSCGCKKVDMTVQRNTKHGEVNTRLYEIWNGIKKRVNSKNEKDFHYKYYAGKNIKMCNEWYDFLVFKRWALSHGYQDDLTIDRIDVNGDYCPDNCRWATKKEQANNKTVNVFITYNGETKTAHQWSEEFDVSYASIMRRYHQGIRGDDLFSHPSDCKKAVIVTDIQSGQQYTFDSVKDASAFTGVFRSDIARICHGKKHTGKGYAFQYVNKEEVVA